MANLITLPNELLVLIAQLLSVPDVARLVRSQRSLHGLLANSVYQRNIAEEPPYESCVLYAAASGRTDILSLARANGADLNMKNSQVGCKTSAPESPYHFPSPLHMAVLNGDTKTTSYLLENGAVTDIPFLTFADKRCPAFAPKLPATPTHPPSTNSPWRPLKYWIDVVNQDGPYWCESDVSNLQGVTVPEMLRFCYPLRFAIRNQQAGDISMILLQHSAHLQHAGTPVMDAALRFSTPEILDRLLSILTHDHYHGASPVARTIRTEVGYGTIALETMRSIFPKICGPAALIDVYESTLEASVFLAIVNDKFNEALALLRDLEDFDDRDYIGNTALHHCWYPNWEHSGCVSSAEEAESFNKTRLDLTAALISRGVSVSTLQKPQNSSAFSVAPLYLASVDSPSGPRHGLKAMEMLLAAGADPNYVLLTDPKKAEFQSPCLLTTLLIQVTRDKDISSYRDRIALVLKHGAWLGRIANEHPYPLSYEPVCDWPGPSGDYPLLRLLLDNSTHKNAKISDIRRVQQRQRGKGHPQTQVMLSEFVRREYPREAVPWDFWSLEDYYEGCDEKWVFADEEATENIFALPFELTLPPPNFRR